MTPEQINDAIEQMLSYCRNSEHLYKEGIKEYESVSAREVLYTLGFTEDEADQTLRVIALRGFNYCLDPKISHVSHNTETGDTAENFPPYFACVWGIDQLRSRLESI